MPAGAGDLQGGGVLVPLGFSYMALELIHYAIESSRGRIRDASFADLAAFALFFPCRVAGPIKRFNDFKSAVAGAEQSAVDVYHGCFRILCGLVKKGVFADALARASVGDGGRNTRAGLGSDGSVFAVPLSGFQRVLGLCHWRLAPDGHPRSGELQLALLQLEHPGLLEPVAHEPLVLGARLRLHEHRPAAVQDPLESSARRDRRRQSYMLTFLTVGAWHGLSLNFLVWGAIMACW